MGTRKKLDHDDIISSFLVDKLLTEKYKINEHYHKTKNIFRHSTSKILVFSLSAN